MIKKNKNSLTLIFPSFQREELLKKRINEISSIRNINVIIVDDGSTPPYSKPFFDNVYLIRNEKNLGRGNSILKALKIVNTTFVSIFDDDDQIIYNNLNQIIEKLKKLNKKSIGIISEAGLNNEKLNFKIESYLEARFKSKWKDRKEFVRTEIVQKSIPFWLKGRRIPTSFIYSLCDRKGFYWEYYPIDVVIKNYSKDGMTSQILKNPFKKTIRISLAYWIYRKVKLLFK